MPGMINQPGQCEKTHMNAYELWLAAGRLPGLEWEFWHQAERIFWIQRLMKSAQPIDEMQKGCLLIGAAADSCQTKYVRNPYHITMKTRLLLFLLISGLLSSCTSYEFKSAQTEEHPCYSTWNGYPPNA